MGSTVNHPDHYNKGKYEVIDVIEDWKLDFCLGNAVKYIARADHKGNFEQDIQKAIWYLARRIGWTLNSVQAMLECSTEDRRENR